ncbi:MAG: EAL domain-containing protein, partial [Clostridia bacterium]
FKLINTTFGRESGNKTLRYIYETLEGQTAEDELVARLSADKFGLLVRFLSKEDLARRLAELSTQINRFNDSIKNQYILQFELGVCLINEPGLPFDILLERANFARQHGIKLQFGQSSIAFYDDVERNIVLREKEIENSMQQALENGEFEMYLQPKYELEHKTIAGAEALVRWNSPEKSMILPGDFIPLFERNGFVVKIDLYIFEQVCKLQQMWQDTGVAPVPISVNMSRVHLNDPDFLERYKEIFHRYHFPANLLEIELLPQPAQGYTGGYPEAGSVVFLQQERGRHPKPLRGREHCGSGQEAQHANRFRGHRDARMGGVFAWRQMRHGAGLRVCQTHAGRAV